MSYYQGMPSQLPQNRKRLELLEHHTNTSKHLRYWQSVSNALNFLTSLFRRTDDARAWK